MRKWHRWIGWATALLLLNVALTGIILQFQQMFGADETTKEKFQALTSAYALSSSLAEFPAQLAAAQAAVRTRSGDEPLDKVELQLKGEHPFFILHTSGKESRKFVVNARTAAIESEARDEESFLLRLHTGEVFGDGGKVLGMFWGCALVVMIVTGLVIYWQMHGARRKPTGWRKLFW
ncbi:MAG: PepSY-associated TM helix domain-containing protein [Verrucomicrobiota bacterium]